MNIKQFNHITNKNLRSSSDNLVKAVASFPIVDWNSALFFSCN